jgi:hypothetical protein
MTTRQPRLYLRMEMTSSERERVDWRSFSRPCLSLEAAVIIRMAPFKTETFGLIL